MSDDNTSLKNKKKPSQPVLDNNKLKDTGQFFNPMDSMIINGMNHTINKSVITHRAILKKSTSNEKKIRYLNDDKSKRTQQLTKIEEHIFFKEMGVGQESKYQFKGKIARGSMGEVFYIQDEGFQRNLVLKVILPKHKTNSSVIDRFIKEARITAQLEHPNIIPVHDFGFAEGYGIYFTMKCIKGESLKDILTQIKNKNPDYIKKYDAYELLKIIRKVCDAIAFAHSKNIIHRDIKPHNIMVGDYGEVLLVDWGLAKDCNLSEAKKETLKTNSDTSSKKPSIEGSPAYMSPEQACGNVLEIDQSSDIYLVGSTLYHIYTLKPPYGGRTIEAVLTKARANDYEPPDQQLFTDHGLPSGLCALINKSMSADKTDRYHTIKDLIQDLDDLISGKTIADHKFFKAGQHLVHEGDLGTESYVIIKGQVQAYKESTKKKIVLGTLSKGDVVCEMALITSETRSASVVAIKDTEVLVLTREHFLRNLKNLPKWMESIVTALAKRLSESNKKLLEQ